MNMIFRDHLLSDLIGFVYSGMNSRDAAHDFLRRISDNCAGILNSGRDALVPIILDGENAWEYYEQSARPFFRELYRGIQADGRMQAVTVSEAFERMRPEPLGHIFPGSWINANFDVWIGAEEDNKAWRLLLDARKALDEAVDIPAERIQLAREELMISEGSDWNWWYGPEHETANAVEFDQIYREHLANVYRALNVPPPAELSHPILKVDVQAAHTAPLSAIAPRINGEVDSYFEWMGAGLYKVDHRSGSMHGKRALVKAVYYGANGTKAFLRVDFEEDAEKLDKLEIQIHSKELIAAIQIANGRATVRQGKASAAFKDVLEVGIEKEEAGVSLCFWQDGLPLEAIPREGMFDLGLLGFAH